MRHRAFWGTIDRLRAALKAGDLAKAKKLLSIALRVHHGPYELQSIRTWQAELDKCQTDQNMED